MLSITISAQSSDLVVIDSNYSQKQTLLNSIDSNIATLEISMAENPFKTIREYLEQHTPVQTVHLFAEATYNTLLLGGKSYDADLIATENELSMLEGLYRGDNIQLLVYNCNLGSNEEGLQLLKQLGDRAYFNIAVSTNCTSIFSPDFSFDHTTLNKPVNASILQ